jgi:hypothetical protein
MQSLLHSRRAISVCLLPDLPQSGRAAQQQAARDKQHLPNNLNSLFAESGSTTGNFASSQAKQQLHAPVCCTRRHLARAHLRGWR